MCILQLTTQFNKQEHYQLLPMQWGKVQMRHPSLDCKRRNSRWPKPNRMWQKLSMRKLLGNLTTQSINSTLSTKWLSTRSKKAMRCRFHRWRSTWIALQSKSNSWVMDSKSEARRYIRQWQWSHKRQILRSSSKATSPKTLFSKERNLKSMMQARHLTMWIPDLIVVAPSN